MKYFVNGWETRKNSEKIIEQYDKYYCSIENQLSDNVKRAINYRHDTHIVKTYFEDTDYIMELDEEIWGKGKIVFTNATVRHNSDKKDVYWLYEEIYKVTDKLEIHISFYKANKKSDIIVLCDDVYVRIEEKEYFKNLYNETISRLNENNNLKNDKIIQIIENKKMICGFYMLNIWEQLIFNFNQIYETIKYSKDKNIDDLIENYYYSCSETEKENIYKEKFIEYEENIKENIKILMKYREILKEQGLRYIINSVLGVYNKNNISMKEKNQMYLKTNEKLLKDVNFGKIYMRILDCIAEGLIK